MATPSRQMASVINPLALAELILGQPLKTRNPDKMKPWLEKALQTPFQELFDPQYRSLPYLMVDLNEKGRAIPRKFPKNLAKQSVKEIDAYLLSLKYRGYESLPFRIREKLIWILIKDLTELGDFGRFTEFDGQWRDLGDFYEEGTEFGDPVQGALGDCYLIAALTAIAWARPFAIQHRNRASGPGQQSFVNQIGIQGLDPGDVLLQIEVNERVPCTILGEPIYAHSSEPGEIWPAMYEKAYGRWRNRNAGGSTNYPGLAWGDAVKTCCELVPGLGYNYMDNKDVTADEIWSRIQENAPDKKTINPMVACTYGSEKDAPADAPINYADAGLVAAHAYTILGWHENVLTKQRYVVLRNPWGWNPYIPTEQTGSWQVFDTTFWRTVPLQENGVLSMPLEDYRRHFLGTDFAK